MKHIYTLLFLTITTLLINAQADFNLELLANVPVGEDGNDIWGYVDSNGIEYAVMGSATKVSIWSLEDPTNPILRTEVPGDMSIWRDMKSFENHIYFTTDEGNDGLGIIDMTNAPETITSLYWTPELTIAGFTDVLQRCHNLYIDEEGYCYLSGCNIPDQFNTNGVIILDLNQDPNEPVMIGDITGAYSHDVVVRENLLYTSDIRNGEFTIYDITDRTNPVRLAAQQTSSDFTHNAWFSDDGRYLFTTDELENSYVDCYDISDLDNIFQTDKYRPLETEGDGVIPHNAHFINDYVVTSWYTDGLVIMDVSDPFNIVKIAAYDTFKDEAAITGRWFQGVWGAYPWLPSGLVLASDINTGLYVFQPTYQRASLLQGTVTDSETNDAIGTANVRILDQDYNIATTDPNGNYAGGDIQSGEISVEFSHPLFLTDTLTANLVNGETVILDAELDPITKRVFGIVIDNNGLPVENATILAVNEEQSTVSTSNADGTFEIALLDFETTIYAQAWGYGLNALTISGNEVPDVEIAIPVGYVDDFFLDLGWESVSDAGSGDWERGIPVETIFENQISNPGSDIAGDLGGRAYITGNGGGQAGNDDVDDGTVTLRTPAMDLTGLTNPELTFAYWFFNDGGNPGVEPNDTLEVSIFNATDSSRVFSTAQSVSSWTLVDSLFFTDYVTDLSAVFVEFTTSDFANSGHLVEGGIDIFAIKDNPISSTDDETIGQQQLSIYPNPTSDLTTITFKNATDIESISAYSADGRQIYKKEIENNLPIKLSTNTWLPGIYVIKAIEVNGKEYHSKLTVN